MSRCKCKSRPQQPIPAFTSRHLPLPLVHWNGKSRVNTLRATWSIVIREIIYNWQKCRKKGRAFAVEMWLHWLNYSCRSFSVNEVSIDSCLKPNYLSHLQLQSSSIYKRIYSTLKPGSRGMWWYSASSWSSVSLAHLWQCEYESYCIWAHDAQVYLLATDLVKFARNPPDGENSQRLVTQAPGSHGGTNLIDNTISHPLSAWRLARNNPGK